MTVKHILIILFLLSNWYTVFTAVPENEFNLKVVWYVLSAFSCILQAFVGIITLLVLIAKTETWRKINDWLDEPITFKKKKP